MHKFSIGIFSFKGFLFTFRDDANITTLVDEQDSRKSLAIFSNIQTLIENTRCFLVADEFTGQLTFDRPLDFVDQSEILTACRDNQSTPFEMFENMTEEIVSAGNTILSSRSVGNPV